MREVFAAAGVIPVLVFDDADHAVPTAEALIKGGLDVLEVTLRTNASWSALSNIIDSVPEASVGVGTVLTTDQMKQAKEVGAAFAVSPGFDPTLVACAVDLDLFYMPGVATASEVMQAYAMELRCLKFFPAETMGGTATLSNFISPFGGIEFCPTGGIHESNLVKYLSLPNVFCVGGTWVATKEDMNARNWQAITARAKSAKSTAQTIYEGHRR